MYFYFASTFGTDLCSYFISLEIIQASARSPEVTQRKNFRIASVRFLTDQMPFQHSQCTEWIWLHYVHWLQYNLYRISSKKILLCTKWWADSDNWLENVDQRSLDCCQHVFLVLQENLSFVWRYIHIHTACQTDTTTYYLLPLAPIWPV